ncbi:MAG: isochorismatase family protein [Bacteroidetes bacterium]|jgi:nicotinamidase/pyrazinamidase|nr:isochorismatase family protein [Bacteroidota bacterium]
MKLIFWDVDTQYDFMMPDGKLYVPGAESLIPNLTELTAFAHSNGIQICGSVDYHVLGDPEISDKPDYHNTFPPHCLQGTPGQGKVQATRPIDPLWIDGNKYEPGRLKKLLEDHRGEIILRKQKFDVFSNPNITEVLDFIQPTDIIIYGVALDVCDAHAIEGFLRLGKYNLYLVTDAAKAIYEDTGRKLIDDWLSRGVKMVSTSEVAGGTLLKKAIVDK